MIQPDAIEAAARKQRAIAGYDWDNMNLHPDVEAILKPQLLAQARLILEAAAPHMLADVNADALRAAWDRGYATATDGMKDVAAAAWDEGYEQGRDRGEWEAAPVREEPTYANPYRPTK